jgi:hypothetical protein
LAATSPHLEERIAEIADGRFDTDIEKLKGMSEAELRQLYAGRDIEPAFGQDRD